MTQGTRHMTVSVAAVFCVLTMGTVASAYQLNTSATGERVRWIEPTIQFSLDPSLSRLGDMAAVVEEIEAAVETWTLEGDLPFRIELVRQPCGDPGYLGDGSDENCIMARDDYHPENSAAGATTLVSVGSTSGEIMDADVVFNLNAGQWSADGDEGKIDIYTVALHELGHAIGLAHSDVSQARMYGTTDGTASENLHQDDRDGTEALYGDIEYDTDAAACSISGVGMRSSSGLLMTLLTFLGATLWIRRR